MCATLHLSWHVISFVIAGFAATQICGAADLPRRPNIIFILTDDQGYGDISRHGNPILKDAQPGPGPHDEGVRFLDFHVSPTCALTHPR